MIDHLVYGAPDLDNAIDDLELRFGVRAAAGGRHVGIGTYNDAKPGSADALVAHIRGHNSTEVLR
jgi:hypothetical protein